MNDKERITTTVSILYDHFTLSIICSLVPWLLFSTLQKKASGAMCEIVRVHDAAVKSQP